MAFSRLPDSTSKRGLSGNHFATQKTELSDFQLFFYFGGPLPIAAILTKQKQTKIANGTVDKPSSHLQPRSGITIKARRTSNTAPIAQNAWCRQLGWYSAVQLILSKEFIRQWPQYRNQHNADASRLHGKEFWVQRDPKTRLNLYLCSYCFLGYCSLRNYWCILLCMKEESSLRLRSSSNTKAHKAAQEQEPAIRWSKGTQQAVVQSPAHTNFQTLFSTDTYTGNTWDHLQTSWNHEKSSES